MIRINRFAGALNIDAYMVCVLVVHGVVAMKDSVTDFVA